MKTASATRPDQARTKRRNAEHDKQRRDQEEGLALDEVIAVDLQPLGYGRTGGERQHDATDHEQHETGDQIAVNGP